MALQLHKHNRLAVYQLGLNQEQGRLGAKDQMQAKEEDEILQAETLLYEA